MQAWFMFSRHTFRRIDGGREAMKATIKRSFDEDRHGSIFVKDSHDATLEKLTLHGPVEPKQIERWLDDFIEERAFCKIMNA